MSEVDFIINVWEGTYREVLVPGYIRKIVDDNIFLFRKIIVVINNVANPSEVHSFVELLQESGEIDAYVFVSDHLQNALKVAGLTRKDLGRIGYYSDWALVAISLSGNAPWICHWDAEVRLDSAFDWISPALDLMKMDGRIAVANPCWSAIGAEKEAIAIEEDFYLGYGFSDQVFLV